MPGAVTFYGLADSRLAGSELVGEVVELYVSRDDAEEALRQVLEDEPAWTNLLRIVSLDFSGQPVTYAKG